MEQNLELCADEIIQYLFKLLLNQLCIKIHWQKSDVQYYLRGFDFDFIGLLWLKDLVWRDNHWVALLKTFF